MTDTAGCLEDAVWGNGNIPHPVHEDSIAPPETFGKKWYGFWGVIVRSNMVVRGGQQVTTGYYTPISFQQIEDGSSNTFVLAEKRLEPAEYEGAWHDDRGWTGGWDADGLRSSICTMGQDIDDNPGNVGMQFGSAHATGMNAGFADGSVHFLSYDLDQELFNNLGHRSDGQTIDMERL
jgi:prepilin-type processing-associated H-X9-DG protein